MSKLFQILVFIFTNIITGIVFAQNNNTIADFTARGGISATFYQNYNRTLEENAQKEKENQRYTMHAREEYLLDSLYRVIVVTYRSEIKEYLPVKELYYNNSTGELMCERYYNALIEGKTQYLENKNGN